jgi:hypothetical protein
MWTNNHDDRAIKKALREGAEVSQSGPIYYTLIWQVLGFAGPSFTQLSKH